MSAIDRLKGLSQTVAIKAPVRVGTTANITLSGLQTIDGVTVESLDRVLVKNQTTASENGIYEADSGDWSRSPDFSGTGDCVQGTLVEIVLGTTNANTLWQLTTASPTIGSSSLSFSEVASVASATAAAASAAAAAASATSAASSASSASTSESNASTSASSASTSASSASTSATNASTSASSASTSATSASSSASAASTSATSAASSATSAAASAAAAARASPPQGRLCLFTAEPVPGSTARTGKTVVYYTPYVGDQVPIYDGSAFQNTTFTELTNDLTASSTGKAGPAAATTNSNYDLFVWDDSGTIRLTRGPLWTSDTSRGTGAGTTELQRINGLWTNKVAITNGPGINLGTYVGTIRTNGSSQANWDPAPGASAGGTEAKLHVFNAYNRVPLHGIAADSTSTWVYGTTTWRSMDNSTGNRVSYIDGLAEVELSSKLEVGANASGPIGVIGVNRDSTSGAPPIISQGQPSSVNNTITDVADWSASIGYHYMQAMEYANSASVTFQGVGAVVAAQQQRLSVSLSL